MPSAPRPSCCPNQPRNFACCTCIFNISRFSPILIVSVEPYLICSGIKKNSSFNVELSLITANAYQEPTRPCSRLPRSFLPTSSYRQSSKSRSPRPHPQILDISGFSLVTNLLCTRNRHLEPGLLALKRLAPHTWTGTSEASRLLFVIVSIAAKIKFTYFEGNLEHHFSSGIVPKCRARSNIVLAI